MHKPILLALALCSALTGAADPSDPLAGVLSGYAMESGPFGSVYHRGWTTERRGEVSSMISMGLKAVEGALGKVRRRPFTAVLTANGAEFSRIYDAFAGRRPSSAIAGVAFPGQDLLVVRGDALPFLLRPSDRPAAVLQHELAHLVIHDDLRADIPRWFDEGAAMWAAGQVLDPDDESLLSGLARVGALAPLSALERDLPQGHDLAALAYEESYLAVDWMAERNGPSVIGEVLRRVDSGVPFEGAIPGLD